MSKQVWAPWSVWRRSSVTSYVISLREDGVALRRAIASLSRGLPADAVKIGGVPDVYEWLEARHWIHFMVDVAGRRMIVVDVASATEE